MAIEVAGKRFVTLADEFFVNGAKVYQAFANGVQVYPEGSVLAGIKIVQPPNKTTYSSGELMDYTGIVVNLIDDQGGIYTDSTYPDGIIPFDELIFPMKNAFVSSSDVAGMVNSNNLELETRCFVAPFVFAVVSGYNELTKSRGAGAILDTVAKSEYTFSQPVSAVLVVNGAQASIVMASKNAFSITRHTKYTGGYNDDVTITYNAAQETVLGKSVYLSTGGAVGTGMLSYECSLPANQAESVVAVGNTIGANVGYLMLYGDASLFDGVPVFWNSPDNAQYKDTFSITVTS